MLKKNEIAGPSCLTAAADDEPVFVLRANDELASNLVRAWAERYRRSKGGMENMTIVQEQKMWEAIELAREMDEWRAAQAALKKVEA